MHFKRCIIGTNVVILLSSCIAIDTTLFQRYVPATCVFLLTAMYSAFPLSFEIR